MALSSIAPHVQTIAHVFLLEQALGQPWLQVYEERNGYGLLILWHKPIIKDIF